MEIFISIVLLILGLVIIIKCGDWFVDAASWLAEVSGIPKLIVGATVVSIATTLPELLVSVFAASSGSVDMAIGNAVGSVTANTGLIMAIALICIPSVIKRKDYLLKAILLMASAAVIAVFGKFNDGLGILPSILLIIIFVVAMTENVYVAIKTTKSQKNNEISDEASEKLDKSKKTVIINIVKFIVGAGGIVLGAELLKSNGQSLASLLGVPERIISVTIIAIGTSLPELVTTVTAIIKKQASLSVGNIIGANIIDLTLILPICSLIYGGTLPMVGNVPLIDLPACFIVTIVALIPTLITKKFSRIQGVILLITYVGYLVLTCVSM